MDADGQRFRQRSHFERGFVADRIDLLFGADEGLSESAVNMRHAHGAPIEPHVKALVLSAHEAIVAGVARQARINSSPVARLHPRDRRADFLDGCRHLMAKDHRLAQAHGAKTTVVEVMEIGAADASEANPHPNVAGANVRHGDLFDSYVLRGIGDDGAHGSDPSASRLVKSAACLLACDRTAGERCRGRGAAQQFARKFCNGLA
jgi:hypothetical protein